MTQKIGFIGLGVMGRNMAGHLLAAGNQLHVFTRTKSSARAICQAGATWHDNVAELAPLCDIIISIVGFPNDVEDIYLSGHGIIAHAKAGCTVIDMTTSSPSLAQRIAVAAATKDISSLDAPISGGDIGAKEARLSIMVGGDKDCFEKMKPIFEIMGKNIVYQGPAGSGQHCKMANQIVIAPAMLGICEALAYSTKSGLDPSLVLESIASGAAGSWALSNLAPRIINGDFDPGFFVKHIIKDIQIACDSSKELGLDAQGLKLALQRYKELAAAGFENDGTQALYKLYDTP
ncbi:MAG: NAD(P)-dependent oxidoreductase [Planctomycetes bacterium]|nr:NAD(P)-dependent oxidoreductase [Planctomycetota bacterium]